MNEQKVLDLRVAQLERDVELLTSTLNGIFEILKVHLETHDHSFHGVACPLPPKGDIFDAILA